MCIHIDLIDLSCQNIVNDWGQGQYRIENFLKETGDKYILINKKVRLRERKRHTNRGVSSTPSVVLMGRGYPGPPLSGPGWGEVPIPDRGYPGTPPSGPGWVPPIWTWPGGTHTWRGVPIPGGGRGYLGTPSSGPGWGGGTHPWWGYPGNPCLDLARHPQSGPGQVPPQTWPGTPSDLARGYPSLPVGYLGTPHLDLAGTPIWTWPGGTHPWWEGVPIPGGGSTPTFGPDQGGDTDAW